MNKNRQWIDTESNCLKNCVSGQTFSIKTSKATTKSRTHLIFHLFHCVVCRHPCLIGFALSLCLGIGRKFGLFHQKYCPLICSFEFLQNGLALFACTLFSNLVGVCPRALRTHQQVPEDVHMRNGIWNHLFHRFIFAAPFFLDDLHLFG